MNLTKKEKYALLISIKSSIAFYKSCLDGSLDIGEYMTDTLNDDIAHLESAEKKLMAICQDGGGIADDLPPGGKMMRTRKAAGISQKELAAMVGCNQVDISRWEAGREPKASMLKRLAEAIGCRMEDLI